MISNKIFSIILGLIGLFLIFNGIRESNVDLTTQYKSLYVRISDGEILSREVKKSNTRIGFLNFVSNQTIYDVYGIYTYNVGTNTYTNKYKMRTVNSYSEADQIIKYIQLNRPLKKIYYEKARPYISHFSISKNNSYISYIGGIFMIIVAIIIFYTKDIEYNNSYDVIYERPFFEYTEYVNQ